MRTDYRFASDRSGYIINVFGFNRDWERPDNFLLIEILYYLTVNRKKRGQIGLEGYFTCRHVADTLQIHGYIPEDVLGGLNYLLRKQLISADHMNHVSVGFEDAVHVLAAGWIHLRVLPERLEYLYGTLATTPIADQEVAKKITETLTSENVHGDVPGSAKARAVRQFFRYLDWQHSQLRQRDIHTVESTSGATYVLGKMNDCLKFYFTKGAGPQEDSDPLDF